MAATTAAAIAFAVLATIITTAIYIIQKPAFGPKAPALTNQASSLLGALAFFTERWDFQQRGSAHSSTGNFSFYAGKWPVVSLQGVESRKAFLESKELSFIKGYSTLIGGSPDVKASNDSKLADDTYEGRESSFNQYFNKRLVALLKGGRLADGLPLLLKDARRLLDQMAADPKKMTDPFESIYFMVFNFTMRTVAANEIANDPKLLKETLHCYEAAEAATTPLMIMYPWLPSLARLKRTIAGGRLYMIFKNVVDSRKKEGRKENDAMQYLIDQGDSLTDMLKFVFGALFAGQLNSGVNAAWMLVYIVSKPEWLQKIRAEIQEVASRHCSDTSLPLKEQLMHVPADAWETEFPVIDLCLKESIRLQAIGAFFRLNVADHAVPLNKDGSEVIPPGVYATYPVGDVHFNPEIYSNPDEYDPGRFLPGREEDKKQTHGYVGWGVGRHPCLGMRFAKLENNLIAAFFLAYFDDIKLVEPDGTETSRLPTADRNMHNAHRPSDRVWLKYSVA